jgi:hypothetical protein
MKPETAQKLIELIQAIDTDHHNDFVDVVCSKYYELPESVIDELKEIAEPKTNCVCHVDADEGIKFSDCVLDNARVNDCSEAKILVKEGKTKTDCKYWQQITFNAGIK